MSSSHSEQRADYGERRAPATCLSIGARLAILYTLSAFGMLATVTAFQYWILIRSLEKDERQILAHKFQKVATALRFHSDNPVFLHNEVGISRSDYPHPGDIYVSYARVLDAKGGTLAESPSMNKLLPPEAFPDAVDLRTASYEQAVRHWETDDGHSYFQISAWEPGGKGQTARRLIQVALDDTGEETLIISYRYYSMIALAVSTLLFALVATLIARRSLGPLEEIARVARRVTAHQLDTRLDRRMSADDWPKEVTQLVQEFDGMLDRLEGSFGRMSRYASDLAHELRTPIQNLIGEAEVALARKRTPDEYRRVLASSLEEYNRLSRMVRELLFLARAEDPRTKVSPVLVDIRAVFGAVRDFHEAQAFEQGVRIVCRGEAEMMADVELLRHALSNLVSNALRHTPEHGVITLRATDMEDGAVELSVHDTGQGIPAKHLHAVFDRFYHVRPERARKSTPGGSGLGLAIVKSVMDLHGGSAAIQSVEGAGTIVTLRFPHAKTGPEAIEVQRAQTERHRSPKSHSRRRASDSIG